MVFAQNLFCKVIGIDVKKNDGAVEKVGYVQEVPLNFADVYLDERRMPAQGSYTDKDGNVILGVSRVFKEDLPTFGYYDMVAAVADLTRKVNALEALLLEVSPELAAKYVEMYPEGVPSTRTPMIQKVGDGNEDQRNVTEFHWKKYGSKAEEERRKIDECNDARYAKLSGGKQRPRKDKEEEEEEDEVVVVAEQKSKKKQTQRKNQRKRDNKKKKKQKKTPPPVNVPPVACKTTVYVPSEEEEESEHLPHAQVVEGDEEHVVVEVRGRLRREIRDLLDQQLDGTKWKDCNESAAMVAADILTKSGKRPRTPESDDVDDEEEEEENSISLGDDNCIHISEDDEMICRELPEKVVVIDLSSDDDDDDVQPMDEEEEEQQASPSLFQFDTDAMRFTDGSKPGGLFDLDDKPNDVELNLFNGMSLDASQLPALTQMDLFA